MERGIQVQVQYVAVEMAPENYKVAKTQKTKRVQEVDKLIMIFEWLISILEAGQKVSLPFFFFFSSQTREALTPTVSNYDEHKVTRQPGLVL